MSAPKPTGTRDSNSDLLARIARAARGRASASRAALAEQFARLYYGNADPQDLAQLEIRDLAGAANEHFELAHRRKGNAPQVRVFNPQYETNGWQSTHTVIQVVADDMPFLVDSTTMEINRLGLALHLLLHPVFRLVRDANGSLLRIAPPASDEARLESFMHLEVDRQTDEGRLAEIGAGLERVLADVRATVEDWKPMREQLGALIAEFAAPRASLDALEAGEAHAFLAWLLDNHMTLLGYRDYDLVSENGEDVLRIVSGSGLGILRERKGTTVSTSFATLPAEVRARARRPEILVLAKANTRATVHRPGYLDYVGVKRFDARGRVIGERRILGLYTHTVYREKLVDIPVVRRKIADVQARARFRPSSHDGKAFASILEDYPRDELLQIEPQELYAHAIAILQLGERQRTRLLVRRDAYGRYVTCLIYVPRDKYGTEQRQRFQQILAEAYDGVASEFSVSLSESPLARVFIVVRTRPGSAPVVDVRAVEARIAASMRRWEDDLHALLVEHYGEARGNEIQARYGRAFPAGYREDNPVGTALLDIEQIEALGANGGPGMDLYHSRSAGSRLLRLRLVRSDAPIVLSDVLPLLENLGVRVLDDQPYEIQPAGSSAVWIVDFSLALPALDAAVADQPELSLERVRPLFHDAFKAMWSGGVESDSLNQLVLAAELSARDISILRAYSRYLRQAGFTFTRGYVQQTLVTHATISRDLVKLFHARFEPGQASPKAEAALVAQIEKSLDGVQSLDEDRIVRQFLATILATKRTNAFQPDAEGGPKPYLSLKFDPRKVPGMPEPRPMYEIWVYSPRVEGVHLRGGPVARGGLRWSDRREDFRTEVLGLMKAQMAKNAVIVPVGSKGGFFVKQPPPAGDREAMQKEGIACYQTFLRGLLDVTDNLVDGKVVPPPAVLRHDEDDPYLVVAADKGTATFSDIANSVAHEYGFWLGDGFASGGSVGYDHKKMGITARGAWESVKRHFRELGLDTQMHPFTVVGIGDMSGDVFGNGMLLSRCIRLVAAFDHRHIFIDPDPDPAESWVERERLFRLPRSSWADYEARLISRGGGVWPRTAKSIPLSIEARRALGIEAKSLSPTELANAILKAPVDLLYNGGIGTYVKAGRETHAQVGDRANDALRVDGRELRCKVVAEGGNLGLTQLGRIEFALAGGRVNTDAIDNSAGVDCSDHEVNIKILLDAAVRDGSLSFKQRNRQLAEMTDEVATLVLRDNIFQTQSLSVSGRVAPQLLEQQVRFIQSLERAGRLNRAIEFLPPDKEIAERRAARTGLTTPERAVLLAYAKMQVYADLLASDLPEDPTFATALERYFPKPLHKRYARQIHAHPLRREIIATHVTNSAVNRVGSTFVHRMREETGATTAEVMRAYMITREAFGMVDFWTQVDALQHKVSDATQSAMLLDAGRLVVRASLWLLHNRKHIGGVAAAIAHFRPGVEALGRLIPAVLTDGERESWNQTKARIAEAGAPEALAATVACFDVLPAALDLVDVGEALGRRIEQVAAAYFALGGRLEFPWLRARVSGLPSETHWQALAKAAVRDDIAGMQRQLTTDALRSAGPRDSADKAIAAWEASNRTLLERFLQVLADLRGHETLDFAMVSVAMRELRNIAART